MARSAFLTLIYVAVFLGLDFAYSSVTGSGRWPGVPNENHHHDLAVNFDGYKTWGAVRYRMFTNSLGFRDVAVREVEPTSRSRRILLIGDSFTEGVGLPFEETFAGRLLRAGQAHPDRVQFLNAGVSSYSPVIYYKKIKQLIERGIRFDEVVVVSDVSDVWDEATAYFCIDEAPEYRAHCKLSDSYWLAQLQAVLRESFAVTHKTSQLIGTTLRDMRETRAADSGLSGLPRRTVMRGDWLDPARSGAASYAPLGVEGGKARSLKNMQALADLLKRAGIPLTIVVYPWPTQLTRGNVANPQAELWRTFCAAACKAFIDLTPAFLAAKEGHEDWYQRLYIAGDVHFSAGGNELVFRELAKRLLP